LAVLVREFNMRQGKLGKDWDSQKNITSYINHALAYSPRLIDYCIGNTWFSLSHRLSQVLKAPEEWKCAFLAGRLPTWAPPFSSF
jgi:hypothetical protein